MPVTARLEYCDGESGSWSDCPDRGDTVRALTYSGAGGTWNGEMQYDVLDLDLGDDRGRLWQVRIACDYTLPDGTEGTVYSTDCGELFAYKGEYVQAVSAKLENGVLTAAFRVDTDLVLDTGPDKLTVQQLSLWTGSGFSNWWNLTETATISPVAEDGMITMTYTLNGEDPDPADGVYVGLELLYNDRDGAIIDWESFDAADVEIPHVAPVIQILWDEMEEEAFGGISAAVELNDLKGGTATAILYRRDETGNFSPVEGEYTTAEYEPDGEDTWYFFLYDPIFDDTDERGVKDLVKVVVDYTYPDEETGSYDSGPFNLFAGEFAWFEEDAAAVYDAEAGTVTMEMTVDESLVDVDSLQIEATYLYNTGDWEEAEVPITAEVVAADDGSHRIRVTVDVSELTAGEYLLDVTVRSTDEYGHHWRCYPYMSFTIE